MREITSHIVTPADNLLKITVVDEPGAGGANHQYEIAVPNGPPCLIGFQNGPVAEHGINGVTQEALLAVVIDRLEAFQAGPFACEENGRALVAARVAMDSLQSRTRSRMARAVEGTNQK